MNNFRAISLVVPRVAVRSFLLLWFATCACSGRRPAVPYVAAAGVAQNKDGPVRGDASANTRLDAACETAFTERRMNDAEKACRQWIAADFGSARAHLLLAHTLANLGRWSEALEQAERASTSRPDWADPFAIIGGAEQRAGATDRALRAYKRYLDLAPSGQYADDFRALMAQISPTASFPLDLPLISSASVTRATASGKDTNADGPSQSHWTTATIFAGLPRAVSTGDRLTVIPIRRGLPSIDLRMTSVKAQAATDLTPDVWLVEAETVDSAFLTAPADRDCSEEHPFEAVVVYPARSGARLLPRQMVGADMPKATGASLRTLWSAVDLDGDRHPDAEIFRFCCDRPSKSSRHCGPSPCESDCERTFSRPPGGSWTLVDDSSED